MKDLDLHQQRFNAGNSSGYVGVWDIGGPDVNNVVNQAGILTGGNYMKWHYIMRGEDGGDAIRCNSANVVLTIKEPFVVEVEEEDQVVNNTCLDLMMMVKVE